MEKIKRAAVIFWAWLDKPAQWFAAAVAWQPKLSLCVVVIGAIILKVL